MIEKVVYHNFKVLKAAELKLQRFNVIAGPSGSGKTTLLRSFLQMGQLADEEMNAGGWMQGEKEAPLVCESDLRIYWNRGKDVVTIRLPCVEGYHAEELEMSHADDTPLTIEERRELWQELSAVDMISLEARYLGQASQKEGVCQMGVRGEGFSRVLWKMSQQCPDGWERWKQEVIGLLEEFQDVTLRENGEQVELWVETTEGVVLNANQLSQGTLTIMALLSLPFTPNKPSVLCIEEVERGIHPRLLREVRDSLYRLAYPEDYDLTHPPVQIVVTTQSPYFLDLFNEHPEEVVFSSKEKGAGTFKRLSEQPDIDELLKENSIGDLWYSGILGGVPYYR